MEKSGILVSVYMLLLLGSGDVKSELVITGNEGVNLIATETYAPQLSSIFNFTTATGPAFWAGDLCAQILQPGQYPDNAVIIYYSITCDDALALQNLAALDNIAAVVELHGPEEAVQDRTTPGSNPYDEPPRYAFNPNIAREKLKHIRVHGIDAGYVAIFMNGGNISANATVTWSQDPWKIEFEDPQWILYEIAMIGFFCLYLPQHSIRALCMLRRTMKKVPRHSRSVGLNLQVAMMTIALVLSGVRIIEYTTQTTCDYGNLWSPEVISQLAWGYSYMILLLSMLLLVLFWGDVLNTSKVKTVLLEGKSLKIFLAVGVIGFSLMTVFICLWVYKISGSSYIQDAGFLLLGVVAFFESVGVLLYGGKLLKQLTDTTPVAERGGGGSFSSPKKGRTLSSDNPSFDPPMQSSSPKASSPRLSIAKFNSKIDSDDNDERRKAREAQRRAKPLTRLVLVSATLLFCATIDAAIATFTDVLEAPQTYIIPFAILCGIEITIYSLVLYTMSPLWQKWRRNRSTSGTTMTALAESAGFTTDVNDKGGKCRKFCRCCFRKKHELSVKQVDDY